MSFKPMLASDYAPGKVKFPVWAQPKVDGVRGLVIDGQLVGRSLKSFPNPSVQEDWGNSLYNGLDGELHFGTVIDKDLCSKTSGKLQLKKDDGSGRVSFTVFDYITEDTIALPYKDRYSRLEEIVDLISLRNLSWLSQVANINLMPGVEVNNNTELEMVIEHHLLEGYEGTILRDPNGTYKQGRSTVKEGGLLRVKKFQDAEAIVVEILEGQSNNNPAETNLLGHTERSTKKSGKVKNGTVGTIIAIDEMTKQQIDISPGKMTAEMKKLYWSHPELIIGRRIKYKFFPHGVKDKPRFPTFQSFRIDEDVSV